MKKNVMMRVASILLICVLLTSSVISGTFAKYVTTGDVSDKAQVAKWGVTIEGTDDTLFAQGYKAGDVVATADEDAASVWCKTATINLVAPGTAGSLTHFDIAGTPEVDVAVTYTATLTLEGWYLDADKNGAQDGGEEDYCPLIFTVGTEEFYIGKAGITNVAELKAAVEAAIVAKAATYKHNTDLSAVEDDLNVSWRWEYYVDGATDVKDTKLGDQAAAGNEATVQLDVTCTVTQID